MYFFIDFSVVILHFFIDFFVVILLVLLYRFFEREVNFGLKLLVTVRTDLEDVVAITTSGKNPFFKFLYCTGLNSDNVSAAKFRKSLSKYKSKLSFFIEKNIENS